VDLLAPFACLFALLAPPVPAPAPAASFPTRLYVRQVRLDAKDLAYDPVTRRIYASVGPNVPGRANSITAVDPLTGALGASVFVGSEPTRLACPPEGKTLYVLLEGAKSLCRFDTLQRKPEPAFPVGGAVEDMYAPAGHPDWVVVAKHNPGLSPRHGGGSLFVGGREVRLYQWGPNVFIPTPDGDTLYGLYNELGASSIGRRRINARGAETAQPFIHTDERSADIKYEAGKLYASSGRIYDFENPGLLGTCTGGGGLVAPQAKANRVYFLQQADEAWRFHAFDTRTFTSLGWMEVPGVQGRPQRLVKWGDDSYAFRTTASQVFFVSPYPDLFTAARAGDAAMLDLLLTKGANPNALDAGGQTPLALAAGAGRLDAVRRLLAAGADPLAKDHRDSTALMAAAEQGRLEVMRLLLARGAAPNGRRSDGATPLLLAVLHGSAEPVRLLLRSGANLNARGPQNRTPLISAILAGKTAMAALLIQAGADVHARSDDGDTALQLATVEGYPELIPLLRKKGAKQ